jgi:starvation-inducible DNA-binding protein
MRATARSVAESTQLGEYDLQATDGKAHLRALTSQYAAFDARLREGIELAERSGDPVTTDLITAVTGRLEQDLWLVESHVNV